LRTHTPPSDYSQQAYQQQQAAGTAQAAAGGAAQTQTPSAYSAYPQMAYPPSTSTATPMAGYGGVAQLAGYAQNPYSLYAPAVSDVSTYATSQVSKSHSGSSTATTQVRRGLASESRFSPPVHEQRREPVVYSRSPEPQK